MNCQSKVQQEAEKVNFIDLVASWLETEEHAETLRHS